MKRKETTQERYARLNDEAETLAQALMIRRHDCESDRYWFPKKKAKPCTHTKHSPQQLDEMRRRIEQGEDLWCEEDNDDIYQDWRHESSDGKLIKVSDLSFR